MSTTTWWPTSCSSTWSTSPGSASGSHSPRRLRPTPSSSSRTSPSSEAIAGAVPPPALAAGHRLPWRNAVPQYASRIISSFFSLALLLVLVFFLSRLTGDPAALFLPVDATPEMLNQFRELHGLNDPIVVQFGRYVWDVLHLDFGQSLRQARPAIDIVLQAFVWTLWLAITTIVLVSVAAIVIGSLAAFRPGGVFDRLVSLISLIGA